MMFWPFMGMLLHGCVAVSVALVPVVLLVSQRGEDLTGKIGVITPYRAQTFLFKQLVGGAFSALAGIIEIK